MDYIGLKVANGTESIMREQGITPGNFDRHELASLFAKSGYSVDDAEAAMNAFDFLDSVDDAKRYIGLKVENNYEEMLAEVGITPQPWDAHEEKAAFNRSGYTEVDARMALTLFDFLDSVDDAKGYIGLKVINGTEDILKDVGITRGRWDSHDEQAAFARSGYTSDDVQKAMRGWDFLDSPQDAREYIGLKVLNGSEFLLREVGIEPSYDAFGGKPFDAGDYGKGDYAPKGGYGKGADYAPKGDYDKGGFSKGDDYWKK
jgi:hypothetical protein